MKIIITGHTKGLGLHIYNHFVNQGHEVIGLSRATGYDLTTDIDKVIDFVKNSNCDYFFNNAYADVQQAVLIKELAKHTMVITSGSMGANGYSLYKIQNPYFINKYKIEMVHIDIKRNNPLPMLLLKMGYLENYSDKDPIMYEEVLRAIDFWFTNTRVSLIEFGNINYDKNIKPNNPQHVDMNIDDVINNKNLENKL